MPASSSYPVESDAYNLHHSAPLLMPPATILEPTMRLAHSTAASFIKRRSARSPPRGSRTARAPHTFDSLHWISAMDAAASVSICDIADLSQLPVENVGPVRRRKSSIRSSPMRSTSRPARSSEHDVSSVLPSHLTERCTTPPPPSRPSYSEISFHNLMPQL